MRDSFKFKPLSLILVPVVLVSALFGGCSQKADNQDVTGLSGEIIISGSSSVQPLVQELADAFTENEPGVKIDVQGGGSTAGIKASYDGTADIGTSSRELNEEEKAWGLTETVIAYDGIAIVVNPSNPVTDLTKDQIAKIFKGEIKNWKDVGGLDKEIIVVSREAGSGTRSAFEEIMKLTENKDGKTVSLIRQDALIAQENGNVKVNVSTKEDAIGYLSLGYLDSTVKALKVDGVAPTPENVKNGSYTVMRPFILLTKGETKPHVKAFLDFITSGEGQETVSKKFITVK